MSELFVVSLISEVLTQGCLNRFFYYAPEDEPTAAEMAVEFVANFVPEVLKILPSDVEVKEVTAKTLLKPGSQYTISLTGNNTGQYGDTCSPPHTTLTYSLRPSTNQFRRGRKAFPTYHVFGVNDGNPVTAFQTILNSFEQHLASGFSWATSKYVLPALARSIDNGAAYEIAFIVAALFQRLSTQNSRKEYTSAAVSASDFIDESAVYDGSPAVLAADSYTISTASTIGVVTPTGASTTVTYAQKSLSAKYTENVTP